MKTKDLFRTAVSNTARSKGRTVLTVLAIFVGAFTLTLTNGVGTGVNRYIDDTLAALGVSNVMSVTKDSDTPATTPIDGKPQEYDPDAVATELPGQSTTAMTNEDLKTLRGLDDVEEVAPVKSVTLDYVQVGKGKKFTASVGSIITGQRLTLATGSEPDNDADDYQVVIPVDYVDALGFDDDSEAIGETLKVAITDNKFKRHTVEAEIVGVSESTLGGPGGSAITPNDAMTESLYDTQSIGLPKDQRDRWAQANLTFDEDLTDDEISSLKDDLSDAGFTGQTTQDQLGAFTTVIDTIVLILNAFAVIALVAAGFGIVNTLLMSVQERTREIGLMKAMGMGSGRVFTLFSFEAIYIGFLGSAIGVVAAMAVGSGISGALSATLLADLPGLQLIAFSGTSIVTTILVIMLVAFLAGTIPAARAARKDPVDALRYE